MSSARAFEPLGHNRLLHLLPEDTAARVVSQTKRVTIERDFVSLAPISQFRTSTSHSHSLPRISLLLMAVMLWKFGQSGTKE